MDYNRNRITFITKNAANDNIDLRSLQRSPYRQIDQACFNCGYMLRPSSYGDCLNCHLKLCRKGNAR